MVQHEASLLVKAFDLKMQNVSKLIMDEAENRKSLQQTLNSIVSCNLSMCNFIESNREKLL